MDDVLQTFPSVGKLLEFAVDAPTVWTGRLSSRDSCNENWAGTRTFEEAVKLARYGWPEGRDRMMQASVEAAALQRISQAAKFGFDKAGAYPDVPRFLGGDPDHMVTPLPEIRSQRPVLSLMAQISSSANVSASMRINWGAALVSWIDILETFGISVEVTWFEGSEAHGINACFQAMLKAADQPVDIDKLAYWLVHPSALRRIAFALLEKHPVERFFSRGYGQPIHDKRQILKWVEDDLLLLTLKNGAPSVEEGFRMLQDDIEAHFQRMNMNFDPIKNNLTY